ncbi:MAG: enoyl-CoA hydratase/isomerase family protein, partial [Phenylobacterium sp.]
MDDPVTRDWRFLKVEPEGTTVVVRLHRPEARNALNTGLMVELTEFARAIRRRTDISTVILTGSDRYFSAGADLAAQGERRRPTLLETREAVMAG